MTDLRRIAGLDVILSDAVDRDTLHAISPPPRREDYDSDEAYADAYWRSVCWAVKVENVGSVEARKWEAS